MTRTVLVLSAMLISAVVAMLALGGCGGAAEEPRVASADGGSSGSPSAAGQPVLDEDERRQRFTECMREHGVDLPDPEPGEEGKVRIRAAESVDKEQMRGALDACRQYLPNGGERGELSPERLEQLRELAQCMREHGVDMADPDPNGGGMLIPKNADGAPAIDEQTYERAFEACRHLGPAKVGANK